MSKDARKSLPVRFRDSDSAQGVTRETLEKMAEKLHMTSTEVIHHALAKLAMQIFPAYEPDDGPLSDDDMAKIRSTAGPQEFGRKISSLIR